MKPKKLTKTEQIALHNPMMPFCAGCPYHGKRKVPAIEADPGEIGDHTRVMILLQEPAIEDYSKRLLMGGRDGREANMIYFPLTGRNRYTYDIVSVIQCSPNEVGKPLDEFAFSACQHHHLYADIKRLNPAIIVAVGQNVLRLFMEDGDIEMEAGFPFVIRVGAWDRVIFPVRSIQAAIGETSKMTQVSEDFASLGRYLKMVNESALRLDTLVEKFRDPDPYPTEACDYEMAETESGLLGYLDQYRPQAGQQPVVAIDTEFIPRPGRFPEPYCLSISTCDGTGRVIMVDRTDLIALLNDYIQDNRLRVVFFQFTADDDVLSAVGITAHQVPVDEPSRQPVDVAIQCFSRNEPVALKYAAYRILNMRMMQFEKLAAEYTAPVVIEYLNQVTQAPSANISPGPRQRSIASKCKSIIKKWESNPDYDPLKAYLAIPTNSHKESIESFVGPPPDAMSVSHFPRHVLIPYACRDADATYRLYHHFNKHENRSSLIPKSRRQ